MKHRKKDRAGSACVLGILIVLGFLAWEASASNLALISVRYERYGPEGLMYAVDGYAGRSSLVSSGPCWNSDPRAWYLGASTHGPIFVDRCAFTEFPKQNVIESDPFTTARTSFFNGLGIFYSNNPHAPTPLQPTKTLWATEATGLSVPAYDVSRPGYIRVKRGERGFGGTMRWFSGSHHFRRAMVRSSSWAPSSYYRWNAMRTRTNNGHSLTRNERGNQFTDPHMLGQRLTYNSSHYATAPGGFILRNGWGYQTIAPFTTGTVTLDPNIKCPVEEDDDDDDENDEEKDEEDEQEPCYWIFGGYDDRYRTINGALGGHLSLVQPFLFHGYPENFDPAVDEPLHYGFVDRIILAFGEEAIAKGLTPVPEPGAILLWGIGLLGLAGLYRGRRR